MTVVFGTNCRTKLCTTSCLPPEPFNYDRNTGRILRCEINTKCSNKRSPDDLQKVAKGHTIGNHHTKFEVGHRTRTLIIAFTMTGFVSFFVLLLFSFSLRVADCLPSSEGTAADTSSNRDLKVTDPCQFCGNLAICVDDVDNGGQKGCKCIEGSESDGGQGCKAIDECARYKPCFPDELGGYCVDNDPPQKYKCGCRNGFIPGNVTDSIHGPLLCTEVDECANGDHDCDPVHGICTNTPGSHVCSCVDGYEGDGKKCSKRIPEVTPDHPDTKDTPCSPDPCKNGDCVLNPSKPKGYQCACWEGYFHPLGVGGICQNRDECSTNTHNCHKHAYCIDTPGSFECVCNNGYSGNGTVCSDIDECRVGAQNPCDGDWICINRRGSYDCVEPTPAPTPQPTPTPPCTTRRLRSGGNSDEEQRRFLTCRSLLSSGVSTNEYRRLGCSCG
jgi:hypothetical protein